MMRIVSAVTALIAFLLAVLSTVEAGEESLRARISQSLESHLESAAELEGIENCENKCDKAFNRFAYLISFTDGRRTFEFRACVEGCEKCAADLASGAPADQCFTFCKNKNWHAQGVVKGVIEPDKACIGGCIINTCQAICTGGTTDPDITPANKKFFFPNGGCSIKTEPYSQFFQYVPFNNPNVGQGAVDVNTCCANALSLCQYVGNKNTVNFSQLLAKTGEFCVDFVPSQTEAAICAFFNDARNCGSLSPPT